LQAKMALVWSKKSTGLPIEVLTARMGRKISFTRLDIDIYKNKPSVLAHDELDNADKWRRWRTCSCDVHLFWFFFI
jgi:DNA topoisomerase VI subunit B